MGRRSPPISLKRGFCLPTGSRHPCGRAGAAAVMLLIKAAGRRKALLVGTQISFSHSAGNSRQHLPWLRCGMGGSGRVPMPAGPPTRVPCCHRRSRLRAQGPSALREQQPGQSWGQRCSGRPCRALGQLYPKDELISTFGPQGGASSRPTDIPNELKEKRTVRPRE